MHSEIPDPIPFIRPNFPTAAQMAEDFDDITKANWFTNFGPKEQSFTAAIEDYLGEGLHATTLANGSLALLAAINATFGRGNGDQFLLMPSFTFIAVAQSAVWCGYRPRFIDIEPDTLQTGIGPARDVLKTDRHRVAGILLPNAFGVGNPRVHEWERLAAEWDLNIVIDSAAGFGSRYADGTLLGGSGSCEVFSFHATKPFAIGEGGAVVSRDADLIRGIREFQNFGFDDNRESTQLGLNAKLPEISAAIGLRQLSGFEERLASRRQTFERYRSELTGAGCTFQTNAEASALCFATICLDSAERRTAVSQSLADHRVQAREYYNPPLHRHPLFSRRYGSGTDLAVTESVCSRVVSLPIYDFMDPDDVSRVVTAVLRGLAA